MNQGMCRVLIVEDNPDIVDNITDYLENGAYELDFATDGIGGLHLALTQVYDVIVLDLMLPGMDGLTLCRKLRETPGIQVSVLMLTARDALKDKLTGFQVGADDYLVKPFALEELEARIQALMRRGVAPGTLQVGDLTYHPGTLQVIRNGVAIELNRACLILLKLLMQASPNVVTRSELEHALWGDQPPSSDALRSHLYQLRQKIDKPFASPLLKTVHGVGFQLQA